MAGSRVLGVIAMVVIFSLARGIFKLFIGWLDRREDKQIEEKYKRKD